MPVTSGATPSTIQVFEVHEPYSGKLFARVAAGTRADGRVAVDAASKAFAGWAETPPAERARLFLKAAGTIRPDVATVYALQDAAQAWKDIAGNLSPGGPGVARRRSHGKIVLRVA